MSKITAYQRGYFRILGLHVVAPTKPGIETMTELENLEQIKQRLELVTKDMKTITDLAKTLIVAISSDENMPSPPVLTAALALAEAMAPRKH